jgi:hypothetical protein
MKKVKYVIFCTIVFYACTNSEQQEKILELEKENKLLIETIDSLKQTNAFKFNEIFSKESGRPDDTMLFKEYAIFSDSLRAIFSDSLRAVFGDELTDRKTFFWIELVSERVSIITERVAAEKKLFGTWEWTGTYSGWFSYTRPLSKKDTQGLVLDDCFQTNYVNETRKIVINEDYTIQYFENGIKTKQDSFYTIYELKRFGIPIHFINQNETKEFSISKKHNDILTFYMYRTMDGPVESFKRIK